MVAMPSPTSTTVPTERFSTPPSNWSMADLMISVMSSERMAIGGIPLVAVCWVSGVSRGARGEPGAQAFQAPPDAAIDESVARCGP